MKNVVKDYSKRYRKARKKEKFEILEEYTVPPEELNRKKVEK